jgi:hypothetical protein
MAMLTFPGGIERTEEEHRVLLEHVGFQLSSITPTVSVISVAEVSPRVRLPLTWREKSITFSLTGL